MRILQRRMMCLVILSVWSFAIVLFLWKQVQDDDNDEPMNTQLLYDVRIRKKFIDLQSKFSIRDDKRGNRYKKSKVELDSPTPFARKAYTFMIDDGQTTHKSDENRRNRDMDVEGVNDYITWYENFQNIQSLPVLPRQKKCSTPAQNIAFLKTHYTGSDVVTSILNRYGDLNNLNVALPNDGLSTFFWPMRFQWKYIDITLLNGSLPNIVANHARYNNDVMDNILHPGSAYITILRDPVTQLETTFNNLGFGELLEISNTTEKLTAFLDNPKFYIQRIIKAKRFKDTLNLIKNGQFFDLGLPTTDYHRQNIIKQAIQEIYDKFTFVLIYEHLDESLVLMKRRLCWQLDDILYLDFHHLNFNTYNKKNLTIDFQQKIRKWNQADTRLYRFFNRTLWTEISYEGEEFWNDLKDFKQLKHSMDRDCLGMSVEGFGVKRAQYFLDDNDGVTEHLKITTQKNVKMFMSTFQSNPTEHHGSGSGNVLNFEQNLSLNNSKNNNSHKHSNTGNLLTDIRTLLSSSPDDGSGGFTVEDRLTAIDQMPITEASSWNKHFCKKLILSEDEYLEYFRIKHAYTKSTTKH